MSKETVANHVAKFLQKWGILLVLAVALLLQFIYLQVSLSETGGVWGAPLDDAWIHVRFAQNLSRGGGFSYMPGVPTPGSTSPLWTVLLAGVGLFTQELLLSALILSSLFFLLTIFLTWRLALAVTERWQVALLAALGVTLTGRLLWASLSGMEVTLFTTLCLTAVLLYQRHGLNIVSALFFGLATQARPEGHVLFALAVGDTILRSLTDGTGKLTWHKWRPVIIAILIYSVIQLPYALFSLSVTGRPLPNTFYAKARSDTLYSWRTLRETFWLHWRDNPLSLLLLPAGLAALWRKSRLICGWLLGLLLLVPLIVPFVWHHGRYTMPLLPFQMIVAAAGLFWLAKKLPSRSVLATGGLIALFIVGGVWALPRWATMLGNNVREVEEIDVAMGRWLAENIPADKVVAVDDIGAIVTLSPRQIVDLNGLVSPQLWPVMDDPDFSSATVRLLATHNVSYLAIFPSWHASLVSDPTVAMPIRRFSTATQTIIGEQEAVVYKMDWPYRQSIDPQNEVSILFGDLIRLRGFDLGKVQAGSTLPLTLYWQSVTAVPDNYKVFIHVLDENGQIVAQADRLPANGLAPTTRWQADDLIRDRYEIVLPAELPSGNYQLQVGLYTEANGRLPINDATAEGDALILHQWVQE
ncbi:hypothetical protein MNBD_CHLOROFLEXI01-3055 [hydrothermal vent metagenome]|uniref:Glycosyltransferase RgtA/B/C/D-like domain-containing protein n=2 Tax=hydrothermal vent metagenome TaxID=652676 RepID=A0A3B0VPF5_9ZZZZ